ncbi:hypothetical protein ACU4GI_10325 [Cupriavidus basilensis]
MTVKFVIVRLAQRTLSPAAERAVAVRVLGVELEMEPLVLMTQSRAVVLAIGTAQRIEAALAAFGGGPCANAAADWWELVGTGLVAGRGRERGAASGVGGWARSPSRRRAVTGARAQPDGPPAPEAGIPAETPYPASLPAVCFSRGSP